MSSLLAPADIHGLIETDLSDASIQLLIDGEEAAIVDRYGPHLTADEVFETAEYDLANGGNFPHGYPWGEVYPMGKSAWIILSRNASSITTVNETIGQITRTLASADYALREGRRLERLPTGPTPRLGWGHRTEVIYIPVDDTARRKRVLLDLVRLSIEKRGIQQEKSGEFMIRLYDDYQKEREDILMELRSRWFV